MKSLEGRLQLGLVVTLVLLMSLIWLIGSHALRTMTEGFVPILIINPTNDILSVRQELPMAHFQPLSGNDPIYPCEFIDITSSSLPDDACAVYNVSTTNQEHDTRKFGPNREYTFEDKGSILDPPRNPYATVTPDEIEQYPKRVDHLMNFDGCAFDGITKTAFIEMLNDNYRAFSRGTWDIGYNADVPVRLVLKEGVKPCYAPPFRLPPHLRDEARAQIEKLKKLGVIQEYFSEWNSCRFLVRKGVRPSAKFLHKDKPPPASWRLVVNLKHLNSSLKQQNSQYAL